MAVTTLDRVPKVPEALKTSNSAEDQDRRSNYPAFADFWDGDQWTTRRKNNRETQLVLNYARSLIRKAIGYTLAEPAKHTIEPSDLIDETAAQALEKLLSNALDRANADDSDQLALTDASIFGEAVTKVTWNVERQEPVITSIHPNQVNLWADPTRPDVPLRAEHGYYLAGFAVREHFKLPEGYDKGATNKEAYPVIETWTRERWKVTVDTHTVIDEPNPYGFVPYVALVNEPRTGRQWGTSDIWDLFEICRELNRRMSILSSVLNISGAPIAVLENVDSADGIKAEPGAVWELPEGAKAYLLDLLSGNGVQLHITAIGEVRTSLHDLSEIPKTAFGGSGKALSGAAMELDLQPAVQRARRKRSGFRRYVRRRNEMVLELMKRFAGVAVPEGVRTSVVFPPILPSDRAQDALTETMLVGSGLSSRQASATRLGEPDPSADFDQWLEEQNKLASSLPATTGTTTPEGDDSTNDSTKARVRTSANPGKPDAARSGQ